MNTVSSSDTRFILMGMELTLGGHIAALRARQGMSQADLATRTGVGRSHLSQIESGKIALPSADIRRRLAKALGVSHVELLVAASELDESELQGVPLPQYDVDDPRYDILTALPSLSRDEAGHIRETIRWIKRVTPME